jgi:hypothetical protein
MNTFVKISVIVLIAAGIILLSFPAPWFPSFYDVRYMGLTGIAAALIILFVPRLIMPKREEEDYERKMRAANLSQIFLAFAFICDAAGNLGLYKLYPYGFEFDKILHFFIPFAGVVILSLVLSWRWGIRKSYAILMALGIIAACGAIWEIFELSSDVLLKTHISGFYGMNANSDTIFDVLFDIIGSVTGAVGSIYLWKYFTGETNVKKSEVISGLAVLFVLFSVIGFYAAYMKM